MPTTRMTATNTLNKGLVMDFNPAITKDDCLVNALNATLLTFNGNEMQLQQDMGNGRVETAFLPEGYIPVGTCEFGDIIYVVSYNPLENKSQIGCFPSPERNITSDEISDMQQSLSVNDFQEMSGGSPTGVIKATSVKKIVYGNKNMNPGDKYIIYEEGAENSALDKNKNTLTDYGNKSHQLGTWPKLLKLKVVSIEDSGKIVDLGASVKWYDKDYYLAELNKQASTGKPDIDSYRSLVSSAYSVFQSKISGKLAILAELEAVTGFSCTYDVYTTVENGKTKYQIYFYTAWETEHNDVNPSGFIVTKSTWTDSQDGGKLIVPVSDGDSWVYQPQSAQLALPLAAGTTSTGGYDVTKVIEYTRLYSLDSPSATFDKYQTEDSFNVKLPELIAWSADNLENAGKKSKLRPVTKVTRLLNILDGALGEPIVGTDNNNQYVFNLDSYSVDMANGTVNYQTKANDGEMINLKPISLTDDVVNNYFGKDIPKLVKKDYEIATSTNITDSNGNTVPVDNILSNLVWNYAVAPVMPYGVLDYLETTGTIDFSKLGKGLIDLTAWRYYTAGNVATLTWGLDAYVEQNKGIAEVVMDFYDNQGIAASYHVTGKSSFAGMFTEHIVLGQQNSSYRLDSTDALGNTYKHAGALADEDDSDIVYLTNGNKVTDTETTYGPYKNDAGTLYPNMLYLVRITVKYCSKDLIGNFVTENTSSYKTFYRWMWTNGIFNEHYYNTDDFVHLKPGLSIDFSATFNTKGEPGKTNAMTAVNALYMDGVTPSYNELESSLFKTLGANVYAINQDGADDTAGNVLLTLNPGLADGFNTFNLNKDKLNLINDIKVQLGKSAILKSVDAPSIIHTESAHTHPLDDNVQPIVAQHLDSHDSSGFDRSGYAAYHYGMNNCYVSDGLLKLLKDTLTQKTFTAKTEEGALASVENSSKKELYETAEAYKGYLDSFSMNLIDSAYKTASATDKLIYVDGNGQQQELTHWTEKTVNMNEAMTTGVKLVLAGISFSKIFASECEKDSTSKILNSIIYKETGDYNSPGAVGLHISSSHMYFNRIVAWEMGESGGKSTRWGSDFYESTSSTWGSLKQGNETKGHNKWNPDFDNDEIQDKIKPWVTLPVVGFAICKNGGGNGKIKSVYSDVSWAKVRSSFGAGSNGNTIYDNSESCPTGSSLGTSGTRVIHTFVVYDQELNLAVPLADYFISQKGTQNKLGGSPVANTLADMLGSLFAQLYVVDEEGDADMALIKNFAYLQDYVETWSKDIIVQVDPSGITQDNIRELITIQQQTAKNFINYVKANSGIKASDIADIEDNVNISLYGTQRVIAFRFDVPYNLGNLLYIYNQKGTSQNKINLSVLDKDGNAVTENFTGKVTANTLYTWTGDNIVPFGQGSSMVYATSFSTKNGRVYMTAGTRKMKSGAFATLAKVLQYDGGELTWHNLSQFSTWNSRYRIRYDGSGDDPGIKNIPTVNIFNEYKPGT